VRKPCICRGYNPSGYEEKRCLRRQVVLLGGRRSRSRCSKKGCVNDQICIREEAGRGIRKRVWRGSYGESGVVPRKR